MLTKDQVTQCLIKKYLAYDASTGFLIWKLKPSKRVNLNSRAGSLIPASGYRSINLFGKSYPEHHVVWLWNKGSWPTEQLDHIDQDRSNNRISNLREVSRSENALNRKKRAQTVLNEKGIWFNRKSQRHIAEITQNGKKVSQQSFKNIEDAISARQAKLKELGIFSNDA